MGAIRGILLVLTCSLFFISIFAAGITFTLSSSLSYDNLKTELVPIVENFVEDNLKLEEKITEIYPVIVSYCEENPEYIFAYKEYTLVFPCELIARGSDETIHYGIEKTVEQVYNKKYDCKFLDCFAEGELPLFLISKKAHDYWSNKFYLLLSASVLLAVLMFLLVEKKSNMPIISGAMLIVASLPFMKINAIFSSFLGEIADFVNIFFKASFSVFVKMLVLGIILLAAGIILKVFGVGFKVSDFANKIKEKREKPLELKGRENLKKSSGFKEKPK